MRMMKLILIFVFSFSGFAHEGHDHAKDALKIPILLNDSARVLIPPPECVNKENPDQAKFPLQALVWQNFVLGDAYTRGVNVVCTSEVRFNVEIKSSALRSKEAVVKDAAKLGKNLAIANFKGGTAYTVMDKNLNYTYLLFQSAGSPSLVLKYPGLLRVIWEKTEWQAYGREARTAIFKGAFKPDAAGIAKAEAALDARLKAESPALHAKYRGYHRQYKGVADPGAPPVIAGNFMCSVYDDSWTKQWREVEGGGDCYFSFQFDPKLGAITRLILNGRQ